MDCLLCGHASSDFYTDTFRCQKCELIFKSPKIFLDKEEENKRYQHHQNSFTDEGYRKFLGRMVESLAPFVQKEFIGLDFGCGPAPVLAELLSMIGGKIKVYDPLFFRNEAVLSSNFYDLVISTEVIEHFKNPKMDFTLLNDLVKENGLLALMTKQYKDNFQYKDWYYKNDPTHVVFYTSKTFEYIATWLNFKIIYNDNDSIVILKKEMKYDKDVCDT